MIGLISNGPWFVNLIVYMVIGIIPIVLFGLALFLIFWSFSVMTEGYISPLAYFRYIKKEAGRYIFGG